VKIMTEEYGYDHLRFLDREQLAEKLGSTRYHGGTHDAGTGHINPLKYVVGLARAAAGAGRGCMRTRGRGRFQFRRQGDGEDRRRRHYRRPGADCLQRLHRGAGAGDIGACDADPLLHRRHRAAG
jgi:hypothetical protein